ncbi:hypothetical protein Rhal01_02139 [Rubritalea halochordaticola]|uniref:Uncharacterized protein n=1 Tax=Rubritalea halochordaticola TaxID=714537 RepID=A0ABP9V0D9_9BACT
MHTTLQKLTPLHRLTKILIVTYTIIEILMLCGVLKKGFMTPAIGCSYRPYSVSRLDSSASCLAILIAGITWSIWHQSISISS